MVVLRILRRVLPILIVIIGLVSLVSLRSCAANIELNQMGDGGDDDAADCVGAGVFDPLNPFVRWPAEGGSNWGLAAPGFCDPVYFQIIGSIHRGLDMAYPLGHGAVASEDATVCYVGTTLLNPLRGNNIELCHPSGYKAIYMHLDSVGVTLDQSVSRGQFIGTIGNTGNSTGPHLHFEVRNPAGQAIDPAPSLE